MTTNPIIASIKTKIAALEDKYEVSSTGVVLSSFDNIATVYGLRDAAMSEIVEFSGGQLGVIFNLDELAVGIVVLDDAIGIREGDEVKAMGQTLSVPVGDVYLGRVVDALGRIIDGGEKITKTTKSYPIERIASGVIERKSVDQPLQTGVKSIDSLIPIGRGQRELIIGDRQTGKTALAIDTILNQHDQDVICIYVGIGQKDAKMARLVEELTNAGAMSYTIIVNAAASSSATMQYIAPYSACAMAEFFMDQGRDVLIIYDDLTKHAVAYREISLLLRRPPGREAYPGDVFYLHSRLLERAARLAKGGSITALPIIETQAGDVSAYIPTNVISITDGQIFLESSLFNAGQRPAVNIGTSVSRVGGAAQTKIIKKISGSLKLELAQYRELASFAQFASDLDSATRAKLDRGIRMMEILKQAQYTPVSLAKQAFIFFVVSNGYLDQIAVTHCREFELGFYNYLDTNAHDLLTKITQEKVLTDEIKTEMSRLTTAYSKTFQG